MIKVEAFIREEKLEEVKEALAAIEVNGLSISQVMGHGAQKGYKELVRSIEVDVNLIPKIKLEVVVSTEEWEAKTIKAICEAAVTGEPGDGKIFSYDLRQAIRIRTGQTGYDALN